MTNRNLAGKDVTGVPPASMTVLLDSNPGGTRALSLGRDAAARPAWVARLRGAPEPAEREGPARNLALVA